MHEPVQRVATKRKRFSRARSCRCAWIAALLLAAVSARAGPGFTIMSFNAWGGGSNEGKPVDETVAAIRAGGADIVALLETRAEAQVCGKECPPTGPSMAPAIAARLGFHYREQRGDRMLQWASAILSRYPIREELAGGLGVEIDIGGRSLHAYTAHLPDWPYQPYQLLGIEYDGAPFLRDEAAAIAAARETRGAAVAKLLATVAAAGPAAAVLICGDFNEPSHRDWSAAAVSAGLQPMKVRWPTVAAFEAAGFVDAFRSVHPDPVARPGFTWSARSSPDDPGDHHDRIDFVLLRGTGVIVESASVVGEPGPHADVVVSPWPSDHRAVTARVRLPDG